MKQANLILSLKIFENTVPEFFSHTEIHFAIYDKYVEGVIIEDSIVSIVWDDEGGEEVYGIYGEESLLTDVNVEHSIDDKLAILTFEFKFAEELDVSTMMIKL